jgi:hypothetical protein
MAQFLEVERKGRRRNLKLFADAACGNALRPRLDQKAKHRKPCFLGEGCESGYSGFSFHNSIIMQIWKLSSISVDADPRCSHSEALIGRRA